MCVCTANVRTCDVCFQFPYSLSSFGDANVSESPGAGTRGIGKKREKNRVVGAGGWGGEKLKKKN